MFETSKHVPQTQKCRCVFKNCFSLSELHLTWQHSEANDDTGLSNCDLPVSRDVLLNN